MSNEPSPVGAGERVTQTDLLQKFHVLPTEPRLTELQKLMGRCRIMQNDLKDFGTEEIGETSCTDARRSI